jgi:hypothetical protein
VPNGRDGAEVGDDRPDVFFVQVRGLIPDHALPMKHPAVGCDRPKLPSAYVRTHKGRTSGHGPDIRPASQRQDPARDHRATRRFPTAVPASGTRDS